MVTRRYFLGLGARAVTAAAATYGASRLLHGTLVHPSPPAVAGRLEYTVTALDSGATTPPIAVTLQPHSWVVSGRWRPSMRP